MRIDLLCPSCGDHYVDFDDYESVVLLAPNLALMQFVCPGCGLPLSALIKLSPELLRIIQQKLFADDQVGKVHDNEHMGHVGLESSRLSYAADLSVDDNLFDYEIVRPLMSYAQDLKKELDGFKKTLDDIKTVDEALEEIDTGYHQERHDV